VVDDFHVSVFLEDVAWKCSREDNVFTENLSEFVLSLTSSFSVCAEYWNPFLNLIVAMTSKTGVVGNQLAAKQCVVGHIFILLGQRRLTGVNLSRQT